MLRNQNVGAIADIVRSAGNRDGTAMIMSRPTNSMRAVATTATYYYAVEAGTS